MSAKLCFVRQLLLAVVEAHALISHCEAYIQPAQTPCCFVHGSRSADNTGKHTRWHNLSPAKISHPTVISAAPPLDVERITSQQATSPETACHAVFLHKTHSKLQLPVPHHLDKTLSTTHSRCCGSKAWPSHQTASQSLCSSDVSTGLASPVVDPCALTQATYALLQPVKCLHGDHPCSVKEAIGVRGQNPAVTVCAGDAILGTCGGTTCGQQACRGSKLAVVIAFVEGTGKLPPH